MKFLPAEKPSPEAVAYSAGFYEGEGYCSYHEGSFRVALCQKDTQPLLMIQRWFGGSLLGPKANGMHYLVLQGRLAWDFVAAVEPYLSDRRMVQLVEAVRQVRCLQGIWEEALPRGPWTNPEVVGPEPLAV